MRIKVKPGSREEEILRQANMLKGGNMEDMKRKVYTIYVMEGVRFIGSLYHDLFDELQKEEAEIPALFEDVHYFEAQLVPPNSPGNPTNKPGIFFMFILYGRYLASEACEFVELDTNSPIYIQYIQHISGITVENGLPSNLKNVDLSKK